VGGTQSQDCPGAPLTAGEATILACWEFSPLPILQSIYNVQFPLQMGKGWDSDHQGQAGNVGKDL
jgi:hypothetical protein